ncbi:conserved hypothetical protein [Burkholderiales bacterium]|nr:conserved hypothetical protein [Burkholderiales bacterium]
MAFPVASQRVAQGMGSDRGAASGTAPCAVIDTNVWLDLFVFEDPAVRRLAQALHSGALVAVRSPRTDAELQAVLARPKFAAKLPQAAVAALTQTWQALTRNVETSDSAPWICRDRDDQKFLDLAFSVRAQALFTKDRALLRLARRARRDGLQISAPADYAGRNDGPGAANP